MVVETIKWCSSDETIDEWQLNELFEGLETAEKAPSLDHLSWCKYR